MNQCSIKTTKGKGCSVNADREHNGIWYCHIHDPNGKAQANQRAKGLRCVPFTTLGEANEIGEEELEAASEMLDDMDQDEPRINQWHPGFLRNIAKDHSGEDAHRLHVIASILERNGGA